MTCRSSYKRLRHSESRRFVHAVMLMRKQEMADVEIDVMMLQEKFVAETKGYMQEAGIGPRA